jgi:DNA-binding NtrC family response regulator
MAYRILVVDDEKNTRLGVQEVLEGKGYEVRTADGAQNAIELLDAFVPDIVVTDLRMPNAKEGLDLLSQIKKGPRPETAVIMMSAYGDIDTAVLAMQHGALDFFAKPFSAKEIEVRVEKAAQSLDAARANAGLRRQMDDEHAIVGTSQIVVDLLKRIEKVAKTNSRVLITGPHGSGKELVAWAVQRGSVRTEKPFVLVNCAAIAETLIEAELFGIEKGSFTGAVEKKIGRFQQADKGTIFLDEIGDMSLAAQAKVLRVIEAGEVTPVGSSRTLKVDVRVIAATNKDLRGMMERNEFRDDLYHRLNTVILEVPPLSRHREDIPALLTHFMHRMGRSLSAEEMFTPEALAFLQAWDWPGNVRELRNVTERTLIFNDCERIGEDGIELDSAPVKQLSTPQPDVSMPLREARIEWEREYIRRILLESVTITQAADRMGLKRPYLHQKMNELGISTKAGAGGA